MGGETGGKCLSRCTSPTPRQENPQAERRQGGANILPPRPPIPRLSCPAARHSPSAPTARTPGFPLATSRKLPIDLLAGSGPDGDAKQGGKFKPMREPVSDFFYTSTTQRGPFEIMQIV